MNEQADQAEDDQGRLRSIAFDLPLFTFLTIERSSMYFAKIGQAGGGLSGMPFLFFFTSEEWAELYLKRLNKPMKIHQITDPQKLLEFLEIPFKRNAIPLGKETYFVTIDPIDPNTRQSAPMFDVKLLIENLKQQLQRGEQGTN